MLMSKLLSKTEVLLFRPAAAGFAVRLAFVAGLLAFAAGVTTRANAWQARASAQPRQDMETGGTFDGPAELPRVYLETTLSSTPAPGKTIEIRAGGDFQGALNKAECGDTITLQAGATFAGVFSFPQKTCEDG